MKAIPCPVCGTTPTVVLAAEPRRQFRLRCTKCRRSSGPWRLTLEDAITSWNKTRANARTPRPERLSPAYQPTYEERHQTTRHRDN